MRSLNPTLSIYIFVFYFITVIVGSKVNFSGLLNAERTQSLEDKVVFLEKLSYDQFNRINALEDSIRQLKDTVISKQTFVSYMARTCHELMSADPTFESGMYYVDPDGWNIGDLPVYVHCSKTGETSVHHDIEAKTNVGHCYDPGCYSKSVSYNATMRQIKALMDLSQNCEQYIRYDCVSAVFTFDDVQYCWWNDRNGQPHYYWDGSNDTVHTCACGITGSCVETQTLCNCDSGAPVALFDEGHMRNKNHLPVTRLNFGRTSTSYSLGEHTLGPLTCSGTYQLEPSAKPCSCSDLWRSGNTMSGFYLVQSKEGTMNTVYCDMSKLPEDTEQETFVGVTDVKASPIYFHVARSTSYTYSSPVPIPFDVTILNIGNAMNGASGRFTAPVKGIYSFNLVYSINNTNTWIPIYHNNRVIASSHTASNTFDSASVAATLSLERGDTIYSQMVRGVIYSDRNYLIHFTGYLIEQL